MENVQKRKYFIFVLAIVQLIVLFWINRAPYQEILARSFNGRGVVVQPLWASLVILIGLILTLRPFISCPTNHNGQWLPGIKKGLLFLAFPVFSGLALYDFSVTNFFQFRFNLSLVLVFVEFLLAFIAINLMWNTPIIKNKFLRGLFFLIFGVLPFLSYSEQIFLVLGFLSGLSLTFFLSALAFKKEFTQHPLRGVAAQFTVGIFSIFFVVALNRTTFLQFSFPF